MISEIYIQCIFSFSFFFPFYEYLLSILQCEGGWVRISNSILKALWLALCVGAVADDGDTIDSYSSPVFLL